MDITDHLCRFLQAQPPARRYVVAYSGGLDSHVLLHALSHLDLEVTAVHVHHGLSPNAELWADHCRTVCTQLGILCQVVRVQVAQDGRGREAAARDARYAALEQTLGAGEMLLTAHHQDDQAETLLLLLLRGAGVTGLAAMPSVRPCGRGTLARPLLEVPRAALRQYAAHHGLSWVDDESNFDTGFDRNFLRHEVLPLLCHRWPATQRALARSAAHLTEAGMLLAELAASDLATAHGRHSGTLSITAVHAFTPPRRRNLLRHWLRERGLPPPDTAHLLRIEREVLPARPDAAPLVAWPGAEVRRYRDDLHAMVPLAPVPAVALHWDLHQPLALPAGLGRLVAVPVTGEGLCREVQVTVRFRQGGEVCQLPGHAHRRSLKNLLQEAGVPPWERERMPLILVEDTLAVVADRWYCAPFAVSGTAPGWRIQWQRPWDIATGGEKDDN